MTEARIREIAEQHLLKEWDDGIPSKFGYIIGDVVTVVSLALAEREKEIAAPTREIREKCEQYWNEPRIGEAEVHAILEFIHARTDWIESGEAKKT